MAKKTVKKPKQKNEKSCADEEERDEEKRPPRKWGTNAGDRRGVYARRKSDG